jgi:hypothetical protein
MPYIIVKEYRNDYQGIIPLTRGYIIRIHWYFPDLEEQPAECELTVGGQLVDRHFTGVFDNPFPIGRIPWQHVVLHFEERTTAYICIKCCAHPEFDSTAESSWTSNPGRIFIVNRGIMGDPYIGEYPENFPPPEMFAPPLQF